MLIETLKKHKYLSIGLGLLLAGSVAWAVADLAGQANQTAADAGLQQTKMTLASLQTAKPTVEKSSIDWNTYNALQKKFNNAADVLTGLEEKAKSELANGPLSASTKSAGLDAAQKVQVAAAEFADFQEKSKCITLAKQTRTGAEALLANADLVFNDISEDKIAAASDLSSKFSDARSEYLAEAKDKLSDADKAEMKSNMLPALQNVATQVEGLVNQVTNLLSQIKDQALSGGVGGLTACASDAAKSDNPASVLLKPVTNLLDMVKNLGTSVSDTISQVNSL